MIKVTAYIMIAGWLILGWFALDSVTSFAHFHIDWACEAGERLVTTSTAQDKVDNFVSLCAQAEQHRKVIFSAVFRSGVFSGFFGVVLVVLGFLLKKNAASLGVRADA